MKAMDIIWYNRINETDADRVDSIKKSIMRDGWKGAPILVCESLGLLITGSHRLQALKSIYANEWDFDLDSLAM